MDENTKNFIEIHELEEYVSLAGSGKKREELLGLLSEIPRIDFGIESRGYDDLKRRLRECATNAYPVLDLSFLNMSTSEYALSCRLGYYNNSYLSLPQFAVYSLDNPKFEVVIRACHNPLMWTGSEYIWKHFFTSVISPELSEKSNLNSIISDSIKEINLESEPKRKIICPKNPYKADEDYPGKFKNIKYPGRDIEVIDHERFLVLKKEDKDFENKKRFFIDYYTDFSIGTNFTELLPQKTRTQIQIAQRMFDEKDIYVIAEARNWVFEEKRRMRDPLVVAITENNEIGYLIDQFDTTSIEDYIIREFTIRNG